MLIACLLGTRQHSKSVTYIDSVISQKALPGISSHFPDVEIEGWKGQSLAPSLHVHKG